MGNAKKIGISLPPDLYEWAAREVEEGRAESVSALVAKGLNVMQGQAEIEALLRDIEPDLAKLTDEDRARIEAARAAAREARRRHLESKKAEPENAA